MNYMNTIGLSTITMLSLLSLLYIFTDSSDEEEDSSFGYYSIHDNKHPRKTFDQKSRPSKMCLSLKIDKGKITAKTDSKVRCVCHSR